MKHGSTRVVSSLVSRGAARQLGARYHPVEWPEVRPFGWKVLQGQAGLNLSVTVTMG